ncbi:hypothetical protein EJB05_44250, partial [Eragrostis curvula]
MQCTRHNHRINVNAATWLYSSSCRDEAARQPMIMRSPLLVLRVVLLLQVAVMAVLPAGARGAGTIGKTNISAIFMFGDSLVDPGNNNHKITEARANFPPYGQDFPGGKPTGRFSNGKVPGDLIASKLGVKELLPPYLGDNLQLNDLLTGVAFASGGSGYDPLTSNISNAISSTGQLKLFQNYKEKLRALVGEEEMTRVISQGIFFTTLNDMGAKKIGFVGIPPIGCCPSQRTLAGGPSSECEPLRNQASALFNTRISKEIDRLNAERNVDGSRIAYIDVYYIFLDIIQNHALYGFKEVSQGCCGSTRLNAAIFIAYHSACPNAVDYIFWDSFHPTEKAYNILVDKLIQQNMQFLM